METSVSSITAATRVVVVNDDSIQLNLLSSLLKTMGIQPAAFKSAESALLAMLPDHPPALIVTDLHMPGIDGWRFCRLLRSSEYQAFNEVPILVVSATYSGDQPSRMTAELGANAFLFMPVEGRKFIETVRALLKDEKPRGVLRVLVVEDNDSLLNKLLNAFQRHGYMADSATACQEGRAKIGQTAYDVAVINSRLPDGLGESLLKDLKTTSPDCVCVMMTDDTQTEQPLEWMKMGAVDFIHKPFEIEYLISQCERGRHERALLRIQELLEERTRQFQQSEERFRTAMAATSDGLWDWNVPSGEVYYSPAYFAMLGYHPDAFPPNVATWENLVHPDDLKRAKEVNEACIRNETDGIEVEFRMLARDGSWHWILGRGHAVRRNAQGKALQLIGTHVDITLRKHAEEALRESEERFRKLSDDIPLGICSFLPDSTVNYANAAFAELFGRLPDQLVGCRFFDLLDPQAGTSARNYLETITADHPTETHEQSHVLPDGKKRDLEWRSRAFFDGDGKITHFLGVGVDITERKQIEDARRFSEERFSTAFHTSPDSININRLKDGLYIDINEGFTALTGYTREDAIGKTSLEIDIWVNPQDRDRLVKGLREKGEVRDLEASYRVKDGGIKICLMSARVIEVNHEMCILSFTRDITERKKAEEALRMSEELLNETQHLAGVGGWAWNVISQTMTWSEETYHIHGMTVGEALSGAPDLIQLSLVCYDPEYRPILAEAFNRCVADGTPYQLEAPFTTLQGEKKWIQTMGKAEIRDGQIVRVSGNVMDMTGRKQAEAALRESEEKFRLIVENQQDLLVKTDTEGRVLFVNPVFCDLFEKTEDELLGTVYHPPVHPDDAPMIEKARAMLFSAPHKCEYEERAQTRHGWRWFSWMYRALLDDQGNPKALIGSGRDITDRKQAEAKINEQLEELRRWQNVTLGREGRVMELKREVNQLLIEFGRPLRYTSVQDTSVSE